MCSHITISATRLRELASTTLDSIKIHRGELLEALIARRQRELELGRRRRITNFFRRVLLLPELPDPVVTWDEAQDDVMHPFDRRDTDSVGRLCASFILEGATEFAKRDYEVASKLLRAANLSNDDAVVVSVNDADCLWVTPRELVDVGKTDA